MPEFSVNIFLLEPANKSKYKTMMVFADDEKNARMVASTEQNPMKIRIPGGETPLIDRVYLDETLSECRKINVEILSGGNHTTHIKYLEKEYNLTKGFAKVFDCDDTTAKK